MNPSGEYQNQPLITLGICSYNAQDTIERAILSAKSQKGIRFEVLVVDDCSTDKTAEIIGRIGDVRLVKNVENKGVGYSRNQILAHARGEYIAFFDDDDESTPFRVQNQLEFVKQLEFEIGVGTPVLCYAPRWVMAPGQSPRLVPSVGSNGVRYSGLSVLQKVLLNKPLAEAGNAMAPTCVLFCARRTLELVGGFNAELRRNEDTDLNIKVAAVGGWFISPPEPLVVQHLTSCAQKEVTSERDNFLNMLRGHKEKFASPSEYNFVMLWFNVKYLAMQRGPAFGILAAIKLFLLYPGRFLKRLWWTTRARMAV